MVRRGGEEGGEGSQHSTVPHAQATTVSHLSTGAKHKIKKIKTHVGGWI